MFKLLIFIFILPDFSAASQPIIKNNIVQKGQGILKITFINVVKKAPMILRSVNYINPFEETYSINKFKYYVSNIVLQSSEKSFSENDSYHLINQGDSASLSFAFAIPAGSYNLISFLLGVDSLHNVSGAQTGALDPVNDMFWTWNSGYVMAKMEGTSPASALNNVFEFHIGGFSGANQVLKKIFFKLSPKALLIHGNKTSEILIESDANAWWQQPNDIKISGTPNITSPGLSAKKISDNYSKMFTLKEIINN
jgi:hypothetical protein